jgi:triacylglycerol lipase
MFGLSLFRQIPNIVMQNGTKIHLLPIVNNLEYYIEERAQSISKLLPKLLHANQIEKCHLIGYSLSGIDARFAISKFGMDKYTKSLTTIATPHLGCKLAWLAERQVFSDKKVEPIARLLGVGLRPFYEVNKENMKHINKDVANIPEVEVIYLLLQYFSIGAERLPNNMTI